MSRSLGILSLLIGVGTVGGYFVHQASKTQIPSASKAPIKTPPAQVAAPASSIDEALPLPAPSGLPSLITDGEALSPAEDQQIKILKSQVEYLEQQNKILLEENSELIDKLASLTGKPLPKPKPLENCEPEKNQPTMENETPDFVGASIELLQIRELQQLPLPTTEITAGEMSTKIHNWLKKHVPGNYGVNQGRALTALGAIPLAMDTIKMKASFWAYQIGSWYDEESQTVFMTKPGEILGPKLENSLGLAYSYLFKNFNKTLFKEGEETLTLDQRLSKESLLAGDASLVRFLHALRFPQTGGGGGVGEDPDDPSRSVPIPNFLREWELQPFMAGLEFTRALHSIGGWTQVNEAYKRPPISAAEVLDTSVYLQETPFTPIPIDTSKNGVLGATSFWIESLGPIGIQLFLRQHVATPVASDVMNGWANDRLLTYPNKDALGDHSVWLTRWKSTDAADAFFNAMKQYLQSKHKNVNFVPDTPQGVLRMNIKGQWIHIQRSHQGYGVVVIQATSDAFRAEAANKFATP